jgi:taurine dioxygenase
MGMTITPMRAALGAVVEGVDATTDIPVEIVEELRDAWHRHQVLFFPQLHLTPAQQLRLARAFAPRLAATTETGIDSDYRGVPTLADQGFPEILLLDTAMYGKAAPGTNVWHTDVTFAPKPPIGSLFCMEMVAPSGGDTMWASQRAAYAALSDPIKQLIDGLQGVHGPHLFVNRGWTASIKGLESLEARHVLNMLIEHSEKPEFQIRWQWTDGDAVLWDNRCTMHYAVYDYGSERRVARRTTLYTD